MITQEEIKVLRLYRNDLIKYLKGRNLRLASDFKISVAGDRGSYFLSVTSSRPVGFMTMAPDIEKALGIKFASVSAGIMRVDLESKVKEYLVKNKNKPIPDVQDEENESLPKEEIIISVPQKQQVKEPETKESRKHATLLNSLREALQTIIPIEELQKQYFLKKYDGRNDTAEVQISDKYLMHAALFILESKGYFVAVVGVKVIASTDADFINSIPSHKRIEKEVLLCAKFISHVKTWMEVNNVVGQIISHPLLLAQSAYSEELAVQCEDTSSALMVEKLFQVNGLQPRKSVHMVYVSLSQMMVIKPFIDATVEKGKIENQRGMTATSTDNGGARYTHLTTNYNELHLLSFNRKIDQAHAEEIGKSIDEFGLIDFVKVVETDCVDGVLKKWIVDGQHTFTAIKKRKMPVVYILIKVDSLFELVRLIAVLNNRRKLWKHADYLHAWMSLNVPIYRKIYDWVTVKKLPFSLVLETISGKEKNVAADNFKDGNFREDLTINHGNILGHVLRIKPFLPRSMKILIGLARFIKKTPEFDASKMETLIKRKDMKVFFAADDTMPEVIQKIEKLYNS